MMYDDAGVSRGYCFITFQSVDSAQKVYANYDHNEIQGQWVDCKPSQGSKAKPGDWYCGMCGDLVFASRGACYMCGYAGPLGITVTDQKMQAKKGDWMCSKIGDHVFASKEACRKC